MSAYSDALMDYLHKMQVQQTANPWQRPMVTPVQTQMPGGGALSKAAKAALSKKISNSLGGSLGSQIPSSGASLVPSAPGVSSGAAEALAQSTGPFLPGQAPITPGVAPAMGIAPYLGAAGALAGGLGIYGATQMNDKKQAGLAGGLSGAGMGVGLGMAAPLIGMGPLGWGALGAMALGGSVLGGGLGAGLAHKTTGEIQAERWGKVGHADKAQEGFDYFAGTGGEKSRDESLLTADAIRNNPDNYSAAADWDKWGKEYQDKLLTTLLAEKKVDERKGGIYYDDARAKQLADELRPMALAARAAEPKTPADKYADALAQYLAAQGVK